MRVSLAWIGILLILITVTYFSIYGYHVYEQFQNQPTLVPTMEGFQNESGINLTMCPANAKSFLDANGKTLCCAGSVVSDTCQGEAICSLSEGSASMPTCSTWWETYLSQKGRGLCPLSMPRYFESADGKSKGCTNGSLNSKGEGPLTTAQPKCMFYPTKSQDEGMMDSCTNQVLLEKTVCFPGNSIPTEKSLVSSANGWLPALIQCKYGDVTQNTAGVCHTNESMLRFMAGLFTLINQWLGTNYTVDQWTSTSKSWDPIQKLNFCSIVKKYSIDKRLSFQDLPAVSVF